MSWCSKTIQNLREPKVQAAAPTKKPFLRAGWLAGWLAGWMLGSWRPCSCTLTRSTPKGSADVPIGSRWFHMSSMVQDGGFHVKQDPTISLFQCVRTRGVFSLSVVHI